MTRNSNPRPQFRNLGLFSDLPAYVMRFPASAIVSLLHRVSGLVLFLLLPVIIWVLDVSLSSEESFASLQNVFRNGVGWVPGWLLKCLLLAVLWSFLHHLIAGLRYLWLDVSHSATEKKTAMRSAKVVLTVSLTLTFLLGLKLFGVY